MNAEKLLNDLAKHDVEFIIQGEHLRIEAPAGVLTEDLRSTLREQKPEILRLLRARSGPSVRGSKVDANTLAAMSLDAFAQAGLIVRVRSEVLGCLILFVSDNVPEAALTATGLPVYRAHELRKLAVARPEPASLLSIHQVKTLFGGVLTDVETQDHG